MASPTVHPHIHTAAYPFNKSEADITLRSSDLVDFHVRRHILFEASPIFESILSIPQSHTADGDQARPVVELTEDHKTLDTLLRICYPVVKPGSKRSLGELESAVKAAQKYEMELPLAVLTNELLDASSHSALQVWAVACRTGLENVARHAARATLGLSSVNFKLLGRMKGLSAGQYYRLVEFRRLNGAVDSSFRLVDNEPVEDGHLAVVINGPAHDWNPFMTHFPRPTGSDSNPVTLPYPDIQCLSSDSVALPSHKGILAAASPVIRTMMDEIPPASAGTITADGPQTSTADCAITMDLPTVSMVESSDVLEPLLQLCYPGAIQMPSDLTRFAKLLAAAKKYRMTRIVEEARLQWAPLAKKKPLKAYFAAILHGLDECAREAAKYTLNETIDGEYLRVMECCPAFSYHSLLEYHRACRAVCVESLLEVSSKIKPSPNADDATPHVGFFKSPPSSQPPKPFGMGAFGMPNPTRQGQGYIWLRSYIDKQVFKDATTARKWCTSCQVLAEDISALSSALRYTLPTRIQNIQLKL
ncbi:hypothetical protein C8Q76DRAFT_801896 [Earliella scabrosa]|nr:hypothetical protein C8Q76DRAFT_801896 [Earliella scabrosa]